MTANMHAILVGLLSVAHTRDQAEHAAREVLAQHAHQLAEAIRQDTSVMGEAGDQYALLYANVIDPKARRASTEGDNP